MFAGHMIDAATLCFYCLVAAIIAVINGCCHDSSILETSNAC